MANPSTFSCVLLLVVLVRVSAASTWHAQETEVEVLGFLIRFGVENPWQACSSNQGNAAAQCSSGGGTGGVKVTMSCGEGQTSIDVASAVTDSRGLFIIAANVTDCCTLKSFVTDMCVVKANLTTANSSCDWPKDRQLIAPVTFIGKVGKALTAVSGMFMSIA